jgi:two-component system LytT family response regulator
MSTVKTLLIDDESAFLDTFQTMLNSRPSNIEIVGTARGVEEGIEKITDLNPDLVFLDIQMEDGTGFDLLRQIGKPPFKFVFVTAYDQFAIDAFKFSATDYLLKPISSFDLWRTIEKINDLSLSVQPGDRLTVLLENLNHVAGDQKKLVLKEADAMHVVKIQSILWCSAEGSYTKFYLDDKRQIIVSHHLKEYETLLEKNGFFRVHRSHLVNLHRIERFDKKEGGVIYLEGGEVLPVSVRKKDALIRKLETLPLF